MKCKKLISRAVSLMLAICLMVPQTAALAVSGEDDEYSLDYGEYSDYENPEEYEDPEMAARRELIENNSSEQSDQIVAIEPLRDDLYMLSATEGDDISDMGLPDTLKAQVNTSEGTTETRDIPVTWYCPSGYDKTPGTYNLLPDFSEEYEVTGSADVPVVRVVVSPRIMLFGMMQGIGTEENPLEIDSAEVFRDFALRYNSGRLRSQLGLSEDEKLYAKLTADIDLGIYNTWYGWDPIGTEDTPFTGEFDGNGHIISNLKILIAPENRGLFGYVSPGSLIENFGLENVFIEASDGSGAIAANLSGTIKNCYVTGSIQACYGHKDHGGGASGRIGGIAGQVNPGGEITGCYVTASITVSDTVVNSDLDTGGKVKDGYAAGIAYTNNGDINNCVVLSGVIESTTGKPGGSDDDRIDTARMYYDGDDTSLAGKNLYHRAGFEGELQSKYKSTELANNFDYNEWPEVFRSAPWSVIETEKDGRTVSLPYLNADKKSSLPAHLSGLKGYGTNSRPYEISSVADLKYLSDAVATKSTNFKGIYFKMTDDITFKEGEEMNPIGSRLYHFQGYFDGGGHKIKNLKLALPNKSYVGLFGVVSGGEISNLGLEDCDVTGAFQVGSMAGMLLSSSITGCYATGKVSSRGTETGGLVGVIAGSEITACWTEIALTTDGKAGGIVGLLMGFSQVTDCHTGGKITCTSGMATGGIAGTISIGGSKIVRCYSISAIEQDRSSGNQTVLPPGYGGILGNGYSGEVLWCMAVNEKIDGTGMGRVVGRKYGSMTLENNIAWMYMPLGILQSDFGGADRTDGAGYRLDDFRYGAVYSYIQEQWAMGGGNWATRQPSQGEFRYLPHLQYVHPVKEVYIPQYEESDVGDEYIMREPEIEFVDNKAYYIVKTVGELMWVSDEVADGNGNRLRCDVRLGNDIDMEYYSRKADWTPIGSSRAPFVNVFDGGGYKIMNLYSKAGGLFGNVCYLKCFISEYETNYLYYFYYSDLTNVKPDYKTSGVIQNLGLVDCEIEAKETRGGGIVNQIDCGAIYNCYVTGKLNGMSSGIAGIAYFSKIEGCMFSGDIKAEDGVYSKGGIVGMLDAYGYKDNDANDRELTTSVSDCYSTGSMEVYNKDAGGIVGSIYVKRRTGYRYTIPEVTRCYTTMRISGSGHKELGVGGIVGELREIGTHSSARIINSFSLMQGTILGSSKNINHILGISTFSYEVDEPAKHAIMNCASWDQSFDEKNQSDVEQQGTAVYSSQSWLGDDGIKFLNNNFNVGNWKYSKAAGELPVLKAIPPEYQTGLMPESLREDTAIRDSLKISNKDDLKIFRNIVNGSPEGRKQTAYLTADIDLEGENWTPIGNTESQAYIGEFYGNGHTVRGLKVNTEGSAGLFGYVAERVKIIDLHVEALEVRSKNGDAGGIVGTASGVNQGALTNCAVNGPVEGSIENAVIVSENGSAGGIVGSAVKVREYSCKSSLARADVTGKTAAGGIIGYADLNYEKNSMDISNCIAIGKVYSEGSAGGIIGETKGGIQTGAIPLYNIALNESVTGGNKTAPIANLNFSVDSETLEQLGKFIREENYSYKDMSFGGQEPTNVPNKVTIQDITDNSSDMYEQFSEWNMTEGLLPVPKVSTYSGDLQEKEKGDFSQIPNALPEYMRPLAEEEGGVYQLRTEEDVKLMKTHVDSGLDKYVKGSYELTDDIVMTEGWEPMKEFAGNLDGGGFTISDLNITGQGDTGLFSVLKANATVSDLTLANATVEGAGENTGILAGQIEEGATVSNVTLSGTVKGALNAGGLAGTLAGEADKVTASLEAESKNNAGSAGAIAGVQTGKVSDSTVTQESKVRGKNAGTVAGEVNGGTIEKTLTYGYAEGTETTGGMAGKLTGGGSISESIFAGMVTGYGQTGGIAGYVEGSITDVFAAGDIKVQKGAGGGIAGEVSTGTVQNTISISSITGYGNPAGGIAGKAGANGVIENNAALSEYVRSQQTEAVTNRIAGQGATGANIAYDGMEISGTEPDGTGTPKAKLWEEKTWTDSGFDTSETGPWTFDGETPFPTLRNISSHKASAPSYLTGFAVGNELGIELDWTNKTDEALNDKTLPKLGYKLEFEAKLQNADEVTGEQRQIVWEVTGEVTGIEKALENETGETNTLTIPTGYEGTFTVRAKMKSNFKKSAEIEFVVYGTDAAPPVIDKQPTGGIYSTGQKDEVSVSVEAHQTDDGILSYQWYRKEAGSTAKRIDGAITKKHPISTATSGTAIYYAVVTNTRPNSKTASVTTAEAEVTIQDYLPEKPEIKEIKLNTQTDRSGEVYKGDKDVTVSVTAKVTSGGALSYRWYRDGALIDGQDEASVNTETVGEYRYHVVVTNTETHSGTKWTNHATSEVLTVKVEELPEPVIKGQSRSVSVYLGDLLSLEIKAEGEDLTYQWCELKGSAGEPISGAVNASYMPNTSSTGARQYYVEVTNKYNVTVKSDTIKVTVTEYTPPAPKIMTQSESQTVLPGQSVTLEAEAYVPEGELSYQWYEAISGSTTTGTAIEGETKKRYAPDTAAEGEKTYFVIATNTHRNKKSQTVSSAMTVKVQAYVPKEPVITTQPVRTVSLTEGDEPVTLTVTARSEDGGSITYKWYVNDGEGDEYLCPGETLTVAADKTGKFEYYAEAVNTVNKYGREYANTKKSEVCTVTVREKEPEISITITEHPKEIISVKPGDKIELSVKAETNIGELSYQWYRATTETGEGEKIENATGMSIETQETEAGTYYYYAGVSVSMNDTISAEVYSNRSKIVVTEDIYPEPYIVTEPSEEIKIKLGESGSLKVKAETNAGSIEYQWYKSSENVAGNGQAIAGETKPEIEIPSEAEGTYYYYAGIRGKYEDKTSTEVYTRVSKVTVYKPETPVTPSGGGGGSSYTPKESTLTIAGVEVPYTIEEGILILRPEKKHVDEILKNTEGIITVDASKISGIKGIEIQLRPSWLEGKETSMNLSFRKYMSVELNKELWEKLRELTGDELLYLRIVEGSLDFSIKSGGREIALNAWEYPVKVTMPWNEESEGIMVNAETESIIPLSMSADGYVTARVYGSGTFDTKAIKSMTFTDTENRWMEEAVRAMSGRGVTKGKEQGMFDPEGKVTRAQFVTMLMRLTGKDAYIAGENYTDQAAIPEWAIKEALTAKALGIAKGDADGSFNPEDEVTRQDMFVMVYRVLKAMHMTDETESKTDFSDWDEVSDYAKEAAGVLSALGLAQGSDGRINPKGTATRAEAVQILYNVMLYVSR